MHDLIAENFWLHAITIPGKTPGMKVVDTDNLSFVDSGMSCDTFNIIYIKKGSEITMTELSGAVTHFTTSQREFCLWVNQEMLTDQLKIMMNELALEQKGKEVGMSIDLSDWTPIKNDLFRNIYQVNSLDALENFSSVVAANWVPPDPSVRKFYSTAASSYMDAGCPIRLLSYSFHGRAVSVVELFPSDHETIGIYALATLREWRGKGIGTMMMQYALNLCKEHGYQKAVLQASDDGIGIYERLGFRRETNFFEYG